MTEFKNWIFDLDGTITVAKHNFVEIKQNLGIPIERDILSFISEQSIKEQERLNSQLDLIEKEIARETELQEDIEILLNKLHQRKSKLGIITRNTKENALISLEETNIQGYFELDNIIGRELFEAKPSPEAIHFLLKKWHANYDEACIVGDYYFDLKSGKNADIATIHFHQNPGEVWPELTNFKISSFSELIDMLS